MSESVSVVGMRGYRPGRMGGFVPAPRQDEVVRLANLERYILRARAGLPLFEDPMPPGVRRGGTDHSRRS